MSSPAIPDDRVFEILTVHSLTWLAAANGVGLLMSTLLLVPTLGDVLTPLSYGRWAPLHLNLALYGWCALPLVGVLLRLYRPSSESGSLGALAIQVWSGTLAAAAVAWLAGETSGKLFLDWRGVPRLLFLANLVFLGGVLLVRFLRQSPTAKPATTGKALLWLGLMMLPPVLFVASKPETYPAINPASGGPTGASLLGSTLAVFWIVAVTPWFLGLSTSPSPATSRLTVALLAAHTIAFFLLDHGDAPHRAWLGIAAVASVLVWGWLLPRHLGRFTWPPGSRCWLLSFLGWGGVLLVSSVVTFLPSVLDRVKFTNVLVAHAHLAMAAMATSFAALVLAALTSGTALDVLHEPVAFALWQVGCVIHVAALVAAGAIESTDPGAVFRFDLRITSLYAARWMGGCLMLTASLAWLARAIRRTSV